MTNSNAVFGLLLRNEPITREYINSKINQKDIGIYGVYCIGARKIYIGSSVTVGVRINQHRYKLRHGKHINKQMQADYQKFGEYSFLFFQIEKCSIDDLEKAEKDWWDMAKAKNVCYNAGRFIKRMGNSWKETGIKKRVRASYHDEFEEKYFKDEATCYKFLEDQRWQGVPVCPHCASAKAPYNVKARGKFQDIPSYRCSEKGCKLPFTVRTGSIFEGSKVELRKWFQAAFEINVYKDVDSCLLSQILGVSQKTAWYMMRKIDAVVCDDKTKSVFTFMQVIKNPFFNRKRHNSCHSK